jgi:hypothetical protein
VEASPPSPGAVGVVWSPLVAVANLVPVVLAIAGATVVVGFVVHFSDEAIEAKRRRKKKDKIYEKCLNMYVNCTDMNNSCTVPRDRIYYVCSRCMDNCRNEHPYYTSECTECGFR